MLQDYYEPLDIFKKSVAVDFNSLAYDAIAGDYSGFIQPLSSSEAFKYSKAGEDATHRLYTDVSTPLEYQHKVSYTGKTQEYIVIKSLQPEGISGIDHHKEVILGVFK